MSITSLFMKIFLFKVRSINWECKDLARYLPLDKNVSFSCDAAFTTITVITGGTIMTVLLYRLTICQSDELGSAYV